MERLEGPARQTPYLKPVAPDKRGRSQQPWGRGHTTPPGRTKLASPGQPSFEERPAGRLPPASQWGPPWPGLPGLWSDGTFPSPGKARTGCEWRLGRLWPAAGAVLAGLGAAGAAEQELLESAAASALMRWSWSSLKCGSPFSFTPASLPRRAVARNLFLCLTRSHALPSPSFSCSALRPPWQGAPTVAESRVLPPLARLLAAMILVIWIAWSPPSVPKPPQSLEGLASGWGQIGWWLRELRKNMDRDGSEAGHVLGRDVDQY